MFNYICFIWIVTKYVLYMQKAATLGIVNHFTPDSPAYRARPTVLTPAVSLLVYLAYLAGLFSSYSNVHRGGYRI